MTSDTSITEIFTETRDLIDLLENKASAINISVLENNWDGENMSVIESEMKSFIFDIQVNLDILTERLHIDHSYQIPEDIKRLSFTELFYTDKEELVDKLFFGLKDYLERLFANAEAKNLLSTEDLISTDETSEFIAEESTLKIGEVYCKFPPDSNEASLCRIMSRYEPRVEVECVVIGEKMTGIDFDRTDTGFDRKNWQRIYHTVFRVNKKIKAQTGKEMLYVCNRKTVKRLF